MDVSGATRCPAGDRWFRPQLKTFEASGLPKNRASIVPEEGLALTAPPESRTQDDSLGRRHFRGAHKKTRHTATFWPSGAPAHDAGGPVAVKTLTGAGEECRSLQALADGRVDGTGDPRWERDDRKG